MTIDLKRSTIFFKKAAPKNVINNHDGCQQIVNNQALSVTNKSIIHF